MIGQAEFHRRRHAEGFVDAAPVVEGDMERDGSTMGADLLTVGVGAPRTPTQVHPHGQVGPLHMVRGGLAEIRAPTHDRRHTACFFVEHHVVHTPPKRSGDRLLIRHGVGHDLGPVHYPAPEIRHKACGILSGAFADAVANDRLAVDVQGQPQIAVAVLGGVVILEMLLLRVDEGPRFIELEAGDLEVTHPGVVQPVAGFSDRFRQPHNGRTMHAGQPGGGAE